MTYRSVPVVLGTDEVDRLSKEVEPQRLVVVWDGYPFTKDSAIGFAFLADSGVDQVVYMVFWKLDPQRVVCG